MKINYSTEPQKFRPFTISIQTEDDYKLMKECITCLNNERKLLNGFQDIEYYNKTKILLEDWFAGILQSTPVDAGISNRNIDTKVNKDLYAAIRAVANKYNVPSSATWNHRQLAKHIRGIEDCITIARTS